MNLYRVVVAGTMMVWAEDAGDAERIADLDGQDDDIEYHAYQIKRPSDVDGWEGVVPYSEDDGECRTCSEIVQQEIIEAARKEAERKEWEAHPKLPIEV